MPETEWKDEPTSLGYYWFYGKLVGQEYKYLRIIRLVINCHDALLYFCDGDMVIPEEGLWYPIPEPKLPL